MNFLHEDCLVVICSFLEIRDLLTFSSVSNEMNSLIKGKCWDCEVLVEGRRLKDVSNFKIRNLKVEKAKDEDLKFLKREVTSLTSLNLSCCYKITDLGLKHISNLANFVNLTSLNLSCCDKITDSGLTHISNLANLTSLNLSYCNKITDPGLSRLSKRIPNCKIESLN